MDETPLFSDNMGSVTVEDKGAKEVRLKTTGNDKKFQSLVLSICLDGSKITPCIVFKGKGKNKEAKTLNERKDIWVFCSDNGWMNTSLTEKWISRAFPTEDNSKKLLFWDSFK